MTFTQIVTKKSLFENFPKGDNIKVALNRKVMQEYNGKHKMCTKRHKSNGKQHKCTV